MTSRSKRVVVKPGMMEMETEMETEILACVIKHNMQTSTMLPWHWTGFPDLTTGFIQIVIIQSLFGIRQRLFHLGLASLTIPGTDITVIIVM